MSLSRGALAAAVFCASFPGVAAAHLTLNARGTTRFVELSASAGRVELVYAFAFGEYPAAPERRRMDLDHDAQLSTAEQETWSARLAARVADDLALVVDGRRVRPEFRAKMDMLDNRLGTIAFLVELTAAVPLAAGAHEVFLDDRFDVPFAGEHEVAFKEGVGSRFVSSSRRGGPPGDERQHRFEGARRTLMEERSVTFRFSVDAAPPPLADPPKMKDGAAASGAAARWGWGRIALLLAALAGFAAVAALLWRRMRRSAAAAKRDGGR